jgi:hypothetical protein
MKRHQGAETMEDGGDGECLPVSQEHSILFAAFSSQHRRGEMALSIMSSASTAVVSMSLILTPRTAKTAMNFLNSCTV